MRSYPTLKTISIVTRIVAILCFLGCLGLGGIVILMGMTGESGRASAFGGGVGLIFGGTITAILLLAMAETILVQVGLGEDMSAIREDVHLGLSVLAKGVDDVTVLKDCAVDDIKPNVEALKGWALKDEQ